MYNLINQASICELNHLDCGLCLRETKHDCHLELVLG